MKYGIEILFFENAVTSLVLTGSFDKRMTNAYFYRSTPLVRLYTTLSCIHSIAERQWKVRLVCEEAASLAKLNVSTSGSAIVLRVEVYYGPHYH